MNIETKKTGFAGSFMKFLVAATVVVGAMGASQVANAQLSIKDSKHNLGKNSTQTNKNNTTEEICVFCHTPHASSNTANVPLWNKSLTAIAGNTYKTYDTAQSSTIDGTTDLTGGVSLACLSCHDGTQAMNNMINQPGSGGYNAAGANLGAMTGARVLNDKLIGLANLGSNDQAANTTGNPDLSNDHPIGIQYCGGGITTSSTSGSNSDCADKDFTGPQKSATANVWWVDSKAASQTANTRQKNDIMLYARTVGGTVQPMVECASCHDPHQANNATFLRLPNTNSDVCLSCHVK